MSFHEGFSGVTSGRRMKNNQLPGEFWTKCQEESTVGRGAERDRRESMFSLGLNRLREKSRHRAASLPGSCRAKAVQINGKQSHSLRLWYPPVPKGSTFSPHLFHFIRLAIVKVCSAGVPTRDSCSSLCLEDAGGDTRATDLNAAPTLFVGILVPGARRNPSAEHAEKL